MEKHILTQEDLDLNPKLVEEGYKVGDEIDWAIEEGLSPDQSSADSDGGDTREGGDPIGTDPIKG